MQLRIGSDDDLDEFLFNIKDSKLMFTEKMLDSFNLDLSFLKFKSIS